MKRRAKKPPVGVACDTGRRRKNNEDSWLIHEPQDMTTLKTKGRLYVVADGMGGAAAGEVASCLAVQTVKERYFSRQDEAPLESLKQAILSADKTIRQQSHSVPGQSGMGTTVTAVSVVGDTAYVAHVGDSRAYVIRREQIICLTRDQTVVADLVRQGKIGIKEAESHPHRHMLTQSVGGGARPPEVYVLSYPLEPGDFLVLCTDGLYNVVSDKEIKEAVALNQDLQRAAEMLVHLANKRGGPDNITAVAVKIQDPVGAEGGLIRKGIGTAALLIILVAIVAIAYYLVVPR